MRWRSTHAVAVAIAAGLACSPGEIVVPEGYAVGGPQPDGGDGGYQPAEGELYLARLTPNPAARADAGLTVVATGFGFRPDTSLFFNGSARATEVDGGSWLSAALLASDVAADGAYPVWLGPSLDGGTSNTVTFTVGQANAAPAVTQLQPCGLVAGTGAFRITLTGTGFAPSVAVTFGGTPVNIVSVSPTRVEVGVPGALIATAPADGVIPVVATNPAPGGGASQPALFGLATRTVTLSGQVQSILTTSCATCHQAGQQVPNLTAGQSYAALLSSPSLQCTTPRIQVKACGPLPSQSYLIAKIKGLELCAGAKMPGAPELSAASVQTIVDWVAQGAPQ